MPEDVAAHARAIIEANAYMTLATSDGEGRPGRRPSGTPDPSSAR